jgi:hypothetical protein
MSKMPFDRGSLILSPMKRHGRSASPRNEIDCANWHGELATKTSAARPVLSRHVFARPMRGARRRARARDGEAAQALYGVTMQEPGVSRLVSVKMGAEAEAAA